MVFLLVFTAQAVVERRKEPANSSATIRNTFICKSPFDLLREQNATSQQIWPRFSRRKQLFLYSFNLDGAGRQNGFIRVIQKMVTQHLARGNETLRRAKDIFYKLARRCDRLPPDPRSGVVRRLWLERAA